MGHECHPLYLLQGIEDMNLSLVMIFLPPGGKALPFLARCGRGGI